MGKPDVDAIDGLSPAISIEQKTTSRNPRSTVGTVTEIHDYMRLLWARAGVPYSPATGLPIEAQTVSQMVDRVLAMPEGTRLLLLAPVVRDRKGEYRKELAELQRRGFTRVKVDGKLYEIGEVPALNRKIKHEIEAVVDRVVVRDGIAPRLADSFETALGLSDGIVYAENADTAASAPCSPPASPARCQRLHDRGDRAAPVQLQLPARRLPGLRRSRHRELLRSRAGGAGRAAVARRRRDRALDRRAEPLLRPDAAKPGAALQGHDPHALARTCRSAVRDGDPVRHRRGARSPSPTRTACAPTRVTKPFEGVIRNLQRRCRETDSVWVREELSPLPGREARAPSATARA